MDDSELEAIIEKAVLANAVKYDGKANPGAVVGQVIGIAPEAKSDMKSVSLKIKATIDRINKLGLDAQKAMIEEKYPELLEKKEKKERNIFEFLGIKEGDNIITAFPPGPEKYPHIGHAKAMIMNYLLAQKYGGKFYLRFEDTNPALVKKEFYDIMQDNFKWLGVSWDKLMYASDYMDLFYKFAEKVISSGDAYMCVCKMEDMRENRGKAVACACRENTPEQNMALWKRFPSMEAGAAVLRLKIDLNHQNSTMRDPTMFRIIEAAHARQGTKYRVWPNYDFQNAIMDGHFNITHRLRSKEFEMRSELQRYIQNLLGLHNTVTYEMARFNLEGVESSGRIIREKIANGELVGWDDPTLTTIAALRRRGFTPDAIRNFVVSTGLTKSESTLTWDDLIVQNKRILDEKADRYFFVCDPVKIKIEGLRPMKVELNKHPQLRKGGRHFDLKSEFYMNRDDHDALQEGELYRFIDAFNFVKKGGKFVFDSEEYENYRAKGKRIMHFLPAEAASLKVEVMMPDKTVRHGLGEETMKNLNVGDIIQSERFGFMRLDKKETDHLTFWYTHN